MFSILSVSIGITDIMNAADLYCNIPKFYDSLNTVVIMQKMNQKVLLSNNAKGRY